MSGSLDQQPWVNWYLCGYKNTKQDLIHVRFLESYALERLVTNQAMVYNQNPHWGNLRKGERLSII